MRADTGQMPGRTTTTTSWAVPLEMLLRCAASYGTSNAHRILSNVNISCILPHIAHCTAHTTQYSTYTITASTLTHLPLSRARARCVHMHSKRTDGTARVRIKANRTFAFTYASLQVDDDDDD